MKPNNKNRMPAGIGRPIKSEEIVLVNGVSKGNLFHLMETERKKEKLALT